MICTYTISILRFLAQGKGLSTDFGAFKCSGRSELLQIALSVHRVAQRRSESVEARPEPLRAAKRSLRAVRGTAQGRPERAWSWSELLRVAQSAPRAAPSRSESLGACSEPLRAALNRPERSLRAARKTDRGARCHMHFAYQMLGFTSPGSLFSVHYTSANPCIDMHGEEGTM